MTDTHLFDNRPTVRTRRLNVLPNNPSPCSHSALKGPGRFPSWLHRTLPKGDALHNTGSLLNEKRLYTVCEEAKCPNRWECWSKKTATFLALGKDCTRACGFCDIATNPTPPLPDVEEPEKIAQSVLELGLRHIVITMVARDDLADGGASHICAIVNAIRQASPQATVELLISDLGGNTDAWNDVLAVKPEIFNHNIETVRALSHRVRHRATYDRTLSLLHYAKTHRPTDNMWIKSGIMVGLGESENEVFETIDDLKNAGCDIITIGQYLQPNRRKLLVKAFIPPEQFDRYAEYGRSIGIKHMYSSPFMRSSYNAEEVLNSARMTHGS